MRSQSLVLAFLALGACALPARAQEAEPPARVLFKEGRELAAKGDYAAACPKFEQSLALESGLGTQFNLADCWERLGKTASAQALFITAADAAKVAGQAEREKVLRERAQALNSRVSKVVLQVPTTNDELSLKRDEQPIDRASWGKPLALDPGTYTFVARAPGRKVWRKKVEVTASAELITLKVPELELSSRAKKAAIVAPPEPSKAPPPRARPMAPVAGPQPAPALPAPPAGATDRGPQLSYSVLALGGAGLAAVTFGGVMGFRYQSANDDAEAICPTSRNCSERDVADHDRLVNRASSARTWAFVGVGVGAAGIGSAAALYVMQQRRRSSAISAAPLIAHDGSFGASLSGSF